MKMLNWNPNLKIAGIDDASFKAITNTTTMADTIPTIWSPELEKNYRQLVFMEQFGVVDTRLVGTAGNKIKINKMSYIGPAEDLEKVGPAGKAAFGAETRWDLTNKTRFTAFSANELVELNPTWKFKAVMFTMKELEESFAGNMQDAVEGLGYSFKLKMDMDCHAAINSSTNIVGKTTWASLVVGDLFDTLGAQTAKLRFDLQVRRQPWAYYEGGTVACLIHPYQAFHLQQDVDWFDVVKRNSATAIFKDELVEWAGIRFVRDEGVPFFAGGALAHIAFGAPQDMIPVDGSTTPNDTWLFTNDGTTRQACIAPRYQTVGMPGPTEQLTVNLDPTTDGDAQIQMIDHHNGMVKFDVPVGASVAPTASFSYGTVYGYSSPIIGPRAFCIAKKFDPRIKQELYNFDMFVGIGGVSAFDVKMLNPEQIVRFNTAVVPPFDLVPTP